MYENYAIFLQYKLNLNKQIEYDYAKIRQGRAFKHTESMLFNSIVNLAPDKSSLKLTTSKADKRKQRLHRWGIKIVKSALRAELINNSSKSIASTSCLNLRKSVTLKEENSPLNSNQ